MNDCGHVPMVEAPESGKSITGEYKEREIDAYGIAATCATAC